MNPFYRAQRLTDRVWISGSTLIQSSLRNEEKRECYLGMDGEKCQVMRDTSGNITAIRNGNFYKVDPDTLSLCSGVPDSDGAAIWEGDIVSVLNTYHGESAEKEYYVVRWNDEAAAMVYTDNYGRMYTHLNGWSHYCVIKVEGNVWDNPELLEKIRSRTPEEYWEELMKPELLL